MIFLKRKEIEYKHLILKANNPYVLKCDKLCNERLDAES